MTTIPPITDELGKYWKQPKSENILIDDTHALMSKEDSELLAIYDYTFPGASYVGKMWRRHNWLVWIGKDITGKSPSGLLYFYREILIL